MARRVYFAFHYQRDIWRVNQIRNSDITKKDREDAGFYDHSLWEESKKSGNLAIKRMINGGLNNTSVTVVLIGNQTYARPWVRYEIIKSFERGNGMIGVFIHQQENDKKETDIKGYNPFDYLSIVISSDGKKVKFFEFKDSKWIEFSELPEIKVNYRNEYWGKSYKLSEFYTLYDWKDDKGKDNFGKWIESAAPKD